jgi:uncharacterized RDD family membrane protein YckC
MYDLITSPLVKNLESRVAARLVDNAVVFISCALASYIGWFVVRAPFYVVIALPVVIYLSYYTVLEGSYEQTVGKKLVNLVVVKQDGSQMNKRSALIRHLVDPVDALLLPYWIIGILSISLSSDRRRLGDFAAGTRVEIRSKNTWGGVV